MEFTGINRNKIGVIGYKGRLGKTLIDKYGILPIDCDITSQDSIRTALGSDNNWDVIINCAAFTNVDGAEKERIRAYAVNTFGPKNLATVFDGRIIQLSSDYIFNGEHGPYDEDDIAFPLSAYGFSKYMGEVALRPTMDRTLIIRTTVLYDNGPQSNFILSVLNQLQQKKPVKVPKTIIGNPTHVEHLAEGIMYCIDHEHTGIINIVGTTLFSRYETAIEIARFFDLDTKQIYDSPAWGEAKRPEKAGLKIDKARNWGVPLFSLWEGLHLLKQDINKQTIASQEYQRKIDETMADVQSGKIKVLMLGTIEK